MKPDQMTDKKIVIFSHYATTGACEELCEWLKQTGIRELVYIAFPFGPCRDRFIRVETYRDGKAAGVERSLFRLKMPEPFAYAKDLVYAFFYAIKYARNADVLVAGDNLLAVAGLLARKLARVKRMVYYMIDYTPTRYANRALNSIYYSVDRQAAYHADAVWPLTPEIIQGRFASGRLNAQRVRWYAVPYGSHPLEQARPRCTCDRTNVVYMGDIVRNKGAELFVPMAVELVRLMPDVRFTVIGGGKDMQSLRDEIGRAGLAARFDVCGFVEKMEDVVAKLTGGGVAIAPYYPFDKNSFTFYSDPGKVKVYLGCGLPIVLTDVPPIAKTIEREGAGRIAEYDAADFARKVASVMTSSDYPEVCERARQLGLSFAWEKVFCDAFEGLGLGVPGEGGGVGHV